MRIISSYQIVQFVSSSFLLSLAVDAFKFEDEDDANMSLARIKVLLILRVLSWLRG
jgi:hypothetical protein